jgi:hypothetical protein
LQRLILSQCAQFLSLSLKYTRLNDDQLRCFPRYLVNVDLSHCNACSARRLCKLLARCIQLQFLALNSCPAAAELFSCEELLGTACSGLQVLKHLELAHNLELDGNVNCMMSTFAHEDCGGMLRHVIPGRFF